MIERQLACLASSIITPWLIKLSQNFQTYRSMQTSTGCIKKKSRTMASHTRTTRRALSRKRKAAGGAADKPVLDGSLPYSQKQQSSPYIGVTKVKFIWRDEHTHTHKAMSTPDHDANALRVHTYLDALGKRPVTTYNVSFESST
jgi:hypothetical protein